MDMGLVHGSPFKLRDFYTMDQQAMERILQINDPIYPFPPMQYSFRVVGKLTSFDTIAQIAVLEEYLVSRREERWTIEVDTSSVFAFKVSLNAQYLIIGDISRVSFSLPKGDETGKFRITARIAIPNYSMDLELYHRILDARASHKSLC